MSRDTIVLGLAGVMVFANVAMALGKGPESATLGGLVYPRVLVLLRHRWSEEFVNRSLL